MARVIENACCVWDFTCKKEIITLDDLKAKLIATCKKWTFQLEKGESGYVHWQGRISLKVKQRLPSVSKIIPGWHVSVTSSVNRDNYFYVTKEDTRIDGPWSDTDIANQGYIPRQIREIKELYPFQQRIVDSAKEWDTRHINCIVDPYGNKGKSILSTYVIVHNIGEALPYVNDYKDMMRMVMDLPTKPLYIIDIPRALKKTEMRQFYAGIESIKDGRVYDDRYSFQRKCFDCPIVWVFSNKYPDLECLSIDRWVFWEINSQKELVNVPTDEAALKNIKSKFVKEEGEDCTPVLDKRW